MTTRICKIAVILLCSLASITIMTGCVSNKSVSTENTANTTTSEPETVEEVGIAFPYEVEDGKILIGSVFQSDIDNPDNNNEYGDGIASIEFTNNSGEYLQKVTFKVTMIDSTIVTFSAADIPADKTVWAFEKANTAINLQEAVKSIECDAVFGDYENSVMEQIDVDVTDTEVTITNNSSNGLDNLNVLCHTDMGDAWFGGITYDYPIDSIAGGDSVTINAEDCFLGTAAVAAVTAGK